MKEYITKAEFISALAKKNFKSKKEAEEALSKVLETLIETFSDGKSIRFVGYGTFEIKTRKARKGRNPKTKEILEIPETKTVVYKPGCLVKEAISNNK